MPGGEQLKRETIAAMISEASLQGQLAPSLHAAWQSQTFMAVRHGAGILGGREREKEPVLVSPPLKPLFT